MSSSGTHQLVDHRNCKWACKSLLYLVVLVKVFHSQWPPVKKNHKSTHCLACLISDSSVQHVGRPFDLTSARTASMGPMRRQRAFWVDATEVSVSSCVERKVTVKSASPILEDWENPFVLGESFK